MLVKIRFSRGPRVARRKGKNSRAALLAATALNMGSICVGALGLWRLLEDFDIAGPFFVRDGLFSHWQVWLGSSAAIQYGRWRLAKHARIASEPEPAPAKSLAANV